MARQNKETKLLSAAHQRLILWTWSVDKETSQTMELYQRGVVTPSPGASASSAMLYRHTASVNTAKFLFLSNKLSWHVINSIQMPSPTSNRAQPGIETK